MIAHLKQKYLEEAHDLLLELEKTLLLLEEEPSDREGVETAFRVMHTLKGSSGMFGFQQVSELVHLLENGYDAIRSTGQRVPKDLLNISLEAVDHIRLLLEKGSAADPEGEANHKLLLKRSAEMLYDLSDAPSIPVTATVAREGVQTWAILFAPHQNMMRNGSNPFYILEELAGLGQLHSFVCTQALPPLPALDPHDCWMSWLLLLVSDAAEESIREAFLFVEDACLLDVQHLSAGDLLEQEGGNLQAGAKSLVSVGLDQHVFSAFVGHFRKSSGIAVQGAKDISNKEEELLPEPLELPQQGHAAKEKSVSSIRVASDKLDDLMNLISELVANQERLSLLAEISLMPELMGVAEEIEKITRSLRDKTFDICLVPIGSLLTRFKRLVRDLSHELNKNIVFEAEGVETELDKNVVDSLSDCLVHIFRNSIDHGLEAEEERLKKGKPAQGKILLKAYNSGTNVVIDVQDDGAGIDLVKVRQKALEKGLIRVEQKLSEQEILELLFTPGFSTAQGVTAVSGRGVGMDVVRKKIKELRGEVRISSTPGQGTTISITLPLTISILDGLMVRVSDIDFVLPLSFVEVSYAVSPEDLENAVNNQLILDGKPVVYFNLADAFAFGSLSQTAFGVVIKMDQKRVVLLVDEIVGEYQAVLKPLGRFYQDQDFLSGGSLKGDGTVALVIDPQKLIQEILSKAGIEA